MNRKKVLIITFLVAFIIFLFLIKISISFSRYQSSVVGEINSNVAFYLFKVDYMTRQIKLTDMSPSSTPYVFTFSVANYDQNKRCEVDLSYVLKIVTTTNIPLRYKLYMNEDYTNANSTNLISSSNTDVSLDDYGTYFQTFTFDSVNMYYSTSTVNNYTLLVYYDETNVNSKYQDTVEGITIVVESQQIIDNS